MSTRTAPYAPVADGKAEQPLQLERQQLQLERQQMKLERQQLQPERQQLQQQSPEYTERIILNIIPNILRSRLAKLLQQLQQK